MNTILSRSKTFLSALRQFFARTLRRIAAILASPQFKKFVPLAILIIIIGIAVPMHFVHAAQPSGFFGWLWSNVLSQFLGLIGAIIVTIINIILLVFSYVAWMFSFLAKGLLNQVIDPAFSQSALHVMDPNGPVAGAWNLLDGLANIVIIFAVLFMGIGTMLDLPNYNWKALLPKVVIAAILINFSLAIVGFGIDIAQVVMNAFLVNTGNKTTVDIITGALAQNLNSSWSIVGGALLNWPPSQMFTASIGAFMTMLAYLIFTFLSIFFYLLFFLYLLARVVALWLLAMVSPLAFAMNVIPSTQQFFNKWKTELINWLLIGPLMAATLFFAAYFIKSAAVTNPPISQTSTAYQTPTSNSDLTDPNTTKAMQSLQLYSIFPELFALLVLYFGYKTSKSWSAAGASFISGQIDRAQKATTNYAQKAGKHYGQQGYSRAKQAYIQGSSTRKIQRYQNRMPGATTAEQSQLQSKIRREQERIKYTGQKEAATRTQRATAFQPKFLQQRDKEYEAMLGMASNDFIQDELRRQSNSKRRYLATQQAGKRNMYGAIAGLKEPDLMSLRDMALALKDSDTASTIMAANPRLMERVGSYGLLTPTEISEITKKMGTAQGQLTGTARDQFKQQFEAVFRDPTIQRTNEMRTLFAQMTGNFDEAFRDMGDKMEDSIKSFVQRMKGEDLAKFSAQSELSEDHVWPYILAYGGTNQLAGMLPHLNDDQKKRFDDLLSQAETTGKISLNRTDATGKPITKSMNADTQSLRNTYNRHFNRNQNNQNPPSSSQGGQQPPQQPNNPPQSPLVDQHGRPFDRPAA